MVDHCGQELRLLNLPIPVDINRVNEFDYVVILGDPHLLEAFQQFLAFEDPVPVFIQVLEMPFKVLYLLVVIGYHRHVGKYYLFKFIIVSIFFDLLELILNLILLLIVNHPFTHKYIPGYHPFLRVEFEYP